MNIKPLDEKELLILEMISEAADPIGSWQIVNRLADEHIETSSATIGRILNKLENLGYLQKEKYRGRVITEKGLRAIILNKQLKNMEFYQSNLNKYIDPKLLEDFLAVLEARRTVERGTARLAAQRVTENELAAMEEILQLQENSYREDKPITFHDLEFHKAIARASRNPILELMYYQLAIMGQQSQTFEYIRKKINSAYMVSHRRIFDALRRRDADEAEAAMLAHIDSLVEDVNKYWKTCLNATGLKEVRSEG